MGSAYPEIFNALAREFHPDDVKVRAGGQGRNLSYVTARTIENRLDEVLGWENWDCDLVPVSDHAYKCVLTITLPDGRRVTKAALGAKSTMSQRAGGKVDPGDDDKGGDSDAFKRVASRFGVARYLHNDGVMVYPDARDDGLTPMTVATVATVATAPRDDMGRVAKFIAWCESHGHLARAAALARSNYGKEALTLVGPEQAEAIYKLLSDTHTLPTVPPPRARGPVNENGSPVTFGWPKSGAALFAWCKNLEQAYRVVLVKAIDAEFCKPGGWPEVYREWNTQQVETAAIFAARIVKAKGEHYDGQFDGKIPDAADLKGSIRERARALLKHHGALDADAAQVEACIRSVAADLAASSWGGEVLDDFDASDDTPKLKQVLDQLSKDLAESEEFSF
jgi:hypothetical protein